MDAQDVLDWMLSYCQAEDSSEQALFKYSPPADDTGPGWLEHLGFGAVHPITPAQLSTLHGERWLRTVYQPYLPTSSGATIYGLSRRALASARRSYLVP